MDNIVSIAVPGRVKDITGERFERLTVVSLNSLRITPYGSQVPVWNCRCDCGNIKAIGGASLRQGTSRSCGCLHKERVTTHGMARDRNYKRWIGMMYRCYNPKCPHFDQWGGRGITVCERWHHYPNYAADIGLPPSPKHQLDRRENDGPYSPDNCRWSLPIVQANNTTRNIFIEHEGKTLTVSQWAREQGMNVTTLRQRLARGMEPRRALTQPIKPCRPGY